MWSFKDEFAAMEADAQRAVLIMRAGLANADDQVKGLTILHEVFNGNGNDKLSGAFVVWPLIPDIAAALDAHRDNAEVQKRFFLLVNDMLGLIGNPRYSAEDLRPCADVLGKVFNLPSPTIHKDSMRGLLSSLLRAE